MSGAVGLGIGGNGLPSSPALSGNSSFQRFLAEFVEFDGGLPFAQTIGVGRRSSVVRSAGAARRADQAIGTGRLRPVPESSRPPPSTGAAVRSIPAKPAPSARRSVWFNQRRRRCASNGADDIIGEASRSARPRQAPIVSRSRRKPRAAVLAAGADAATAMHSCSTIWRCHYPWASRYRFYAWALCRPWSQYCRPRELPAPMLVVDARIRRSSRPRVEQEVTEIIPDDGRGLDADCTGVEFASRHLSFAAKARVAGAST